LGFSEGHFWGLVRATFGGLVSTRLQYWGLGSRRHFWKLMKQSLGGGEGGKRVFGTLGKGLGNFTVQKALLTTLFHHFWGFLKRLG
jgi:hypothetical protein